MRERGANYSTIN